jgi:hypothetical protein
VKPAWTDLISELTSLRSSITNYYYENGRRYHAYHAGAYWYDMSLAVQLDADSSRGPNDERAAQHMEIGYIPSYIDPRLGLIYIDTKFIVYFYTANYI